MTIPEIGTLKAEHRPLVFITSNRTREVHDALKRRCIYHWIPYPSAAKELEIVRRKVPRVAERLSEQVVSFVQALREQELHKLPGVAETLDWAEALMHLGAAELDETLVSATIGMLLKYQDDVDAVRGSLGESLVARATSPR